MCRPMPFVSPWMSAAAALVNTSVRWFAAPMRAVINEVVSSAVKGPRCARTVIPWLTDQCDIILIRRQPDDQPTTQQCFPAPDVTCEQKQASAGMNPIAQPPVRRVVLRGRDIESRVRHIVEREGPESPIYCIVDICVHCAINIARRGRLHQASGRSCVLGSDTSIMSGWLAATDRSRHAGPAHAPPTDGWHSPSHAAASSPLPPARQPETLALAPPPSADCADL